ncbi:MAG: hypothetical protein WCO94_12615 [Verrucomicrobiota bacterium]
MTPPLRVSHNARLEQNSLGANISMSRPRGWKHPWFTEAKWMPKKKAWMAFAVAGFVNGTAPMVRATVGDLKESNGTFYGQLVDAYTGAAEIKQLAQLAISEADSSGLADNAVVDVPLYQNPPISLTEWRAIGWDGAGSVPQFFLDRGVNKPSKATAAITGANANTGIVLNAADLVPPKGNRLLRACDIFIHQPRTALTSNITISPDGGMVTGLSAVNQTLAFRDAAANDRLKIQTGTYSAFQQGKLNFSGATNVMASDYEEKNWDEILISTVYLMSPPDVALDAKPDATWQAFTKHNLFWNLLWAQPAIQPFFNMDIFRSITGLVSVLGGGAGSGLVNFIAASINDATQGAYNILQSQSLAGSFWTPTGGGTTSAWPVTVAAPAKPTLNKAAAAAAKAQAAAKAKRNRTLDPAFPFEGNKFNLSLIK